MFYKITLVDGNIFELPMNSNSFIISHGDDYMRWWNSCYIEDEWKAHYYYVRETEDGKYFCEFVCNHNEEQYLKKSSLYTEVKSVVLTDGDE